MQIKRTGTGAIRARCPPCLGSQRPYRQNFQTSGCTTRPDRRVARGAENLGSLHGVPVALKDLTPTAGIPTTRGSQLFRSTVPQEDAILVQRLKAAGAIILGKTNRPEFGHKAETDNLVFGPTRNPWDLDRTPGGSSGGSAAAVAAGLVPLAEGSDGAGSIRIPATMCGTFGFKPTYAACPMSQAASPA